MNVDLAATPSAVRADEGHLRGSAGYRAVTVALFAAGLSTFISMYSAQALLPALAEGFVISPAVSALSVSMTTGLLAVAIIPASVLSERFGRTRVMVVSAVISCLIGLLLPLSPNIEFLLAGRALQGVALAGIPAVAMAYLAEEIHPKHLGAAMGRYVAGTTIGGLIGRLVPSAVIDVSTWRWGMAAAALLALAFALTMILALPRSRYFVAQDVNPATVWANLRGHLADPGLRALFALGFVLMGSFVSVYNFMGFRLASEPFRLPESIVALVFLLYLAGTYTSAAAGAASDRLGRRWVLLGSVVVTLAGLAMTVPDSLPTTLAGMLLFTGGFFAAHAVACGWVGMLARGHRAEASALYLFAYYLGSSIAGAVAGIAYGVGGWVAMSLFVGALLSMGIILSITLFRSTGAEV